jgi:hypothetical protein
VNVLSAEDRSQPDSVLAKLRKALPGFQTFKPFIQRFASTTHAVAWVLEILKNQGLDQASFQKCWQICQSLPTRSKVKTPSRLEADASAGANTLNYAPGAARGAGQFARASRGERLP